MKPVSRRDFLRFGGLAVVSALPTAFTLQASTNPTPARAKLTVGVILPHDSQAGAQFLAGARLVGAQTLADTVLVR